MTIFLEIAKKYLIKDLTKIQEKSVQKDKGLSNTFIGFIGLGRDTELSATKRDLLRRLMSDIEQFKDKPSDQESFTALNFMITQCRESAKKESTKKKYDEGTFGNKIVDVMTMLSDVYHKFLTRNMLDIPYDKDPFNIYRFFAGYYLAHKLSEARNPSFLESTLSNPQISSANELAQQKEDLLFEAIQSCSDDLDTLDKEHNHYPQTRRRRVLASIEELRRGNKSKCKDHGGEASIPLSLTMFASVSVPAPVIGPGVGSLDEYMKAATQEINEHAAEEATCTSSSSASCTSTI